MILSEYLIHNYVNGLQPNVAVNEEEKLQMPAQKAGKHKKTLQANL